MRRSIFALAVLAGLFPGQAATALEIIQYDRLAPGDQARFVSGLVRGAENLLNKSGHADQSKKVAQMFPDPDRATATPLFKTTLAQERDADLKRNIEMPESTRLEVEDALLGLFKKNGFTLPDDFYIVNRDFRARLPVKPL